VPGPGDLFETANDLLMASAEALDTVPELLGTHLLGAPERQLISPGNPVHDCCEQLVVWVNPLGTGARTPQTLEPEMHITRPTFRVHATRCVPSGKIVGKKYVPPSAESLTESAEQLLADGWALWNHINNLMRADLLFSQCGDLVNWSSQALSPLGGCAGWEMQFTIGLDGYNEDLAT
jgi:hypothetical protein